MRSASSSTGRRSASPASKRRCRCASIGWYMRASSRSHASWSCCRSTRRGSCACRAVRFRKARRPTSRCWPRTCGSLYRRRGCARNRRTHPLTAGICAAASPRPSSAAGPSIRTTTRPSACRRSAKDGQTRGTSRQGTAGPAAIRRLDAEWALRLRQRLSRPRLPQSAPAFPPPANNRAFRPEPIRLAPNRNRPAARSGAGAGHCGALLAHTIAGLLDIRRSLTHPPCSFAPFNYDPSGGFALREFYRRELHGKRVLLTDDVRNTCETLSRCATLVKDAGGTVIATAQIYDRMEAVTHLDVPNIALAEYNASDNFKQADCPLCKAGVPITQF